MIAIEVKGLNPGDKVIAKVGPYKECECTVIKVELDAGARNGWVTVSLPQGGTAMFAGEEIRRP